MPCLVLILMLLVPRVALVLIYFLTPWFEMVFTTWLWPVLGFLFMPLTMLAYAWAINTSGSVSSGYFAVVLIAALVDLGVIGGSARRRRRRSR